MDGFGILDLVIKQLTFTKPKSIKQAPPARSHSGGGFEGCGVEVPTPPSKRKAPTLSEAGVLSVVGTTVCYS